MNLESILTGPKLFDREILRLFSKLTKKWESKGRSKYTLSNLINIPMSIFNIEIFHNIPAGCLMLHNVIMDNSKALYDVDIYSENSPGSEILHPYRMVDKITRFPSFVVGVGFTSVGLYQIITGYINSDNESLSKGIENVKCGLPFTSAASSLYIRGSDQKLLNETPAWAKTPESDVRKLEPVPIRNYSTIEDQIQ